MDEKAILKAIEDLSQHIDQRFDDHEKYNANVHKNTDKEILSLKNAVFGNEQAGLKIDMTKIMTSAGMIKWGSG